MNGFRNRAVFLVLFCAATVCVLVLMWQARMILLLLFAGCIGALILTMLTSSIQSFLHIRRSLSLAIVLGLMAAVLGVGIWTQGSSLLQQLSSLQSDIIDAVSQLSSRLQNRPWVHWLMIHSADSAQVSHALSAALSRIGDAINVSISTVAGLFLVVLASVYLAVEPDLYLRAIRRIVPNSSKTLFESCSASAVRMLRAWLLAKVVSMASIGLLVALGLLALHIPLAGTLGAIAALLTFIPNLGPILSLLPAALIAFAISPLKGILTIALFCLAHFLEGNIITPLAERKIASLPPALTLTMQLLLGSATGALGIVLAAPFTAVLLGVLQVLLPPATRASGHTCEECDAVVKIHERSPLLPNPGSRVS